MKTEGMYLVFHTNGMEPDEKKECARYDAVLRSVGDVDIQLLGIGRNGHIGFNEPDNCFAKGTHCVELTESTIEANKRFFASEDEVPRRAYSMGIHTIMTAKKSAGRCQRRGQGVGYP